MSHNLSENYCAMTTPIKSVFCYEILPNHFRKFTVIIKPADITVTIFGIICFMVVNPKFRKNIMDILIELFYIIVLFYVVGRIILYSERI